MQTVTLTLSESYDRAYDQLVRVHQLVELEEIMCYRGAQRRSDTDMTRTIEQLWSNRLLMLRAETRVWQDVLNPRLMGLCWHEDAVCVCGGGVFASVVNLYVSVCECM